MAYAARSPLVGALESLVEEQVGRDASCPNGAGVLRAAGRRRLHRCAQRDRRRRARAASSWCVNCHAPGENLRPAMPAWSAVRRRARPGADARPACPPASREGVSCAACHSTVGPVAAHAARARGYEGNPTWTSTATGVDVPRPPGGRARPPGHRQLGLPPRPAAAPRRRRATGRASTLRRRGRDRALPRVERVLRRVPRRPPLRHRRPGRAARRALQAAAQRVLRVAHLGRRRGARGPRRADLPGLPHEPLPGASRPGTYAAGRSWRRRSRAPARVASHWFTGVEIPLATSCPTRSSTIPRSTRTASRSACAPGGTRSSARRSACRSARGAAPGATLEVPRHARERGRRAPRARRASARSARPGWSCAVTDARGGSSTRSAGSTDPTRTSPTSASSA